VGRPIWLRYLLFQLPGWVAAGAALAFVQMQGWLEAPWPLALFGGLVIKDAVLYPWMRIAHEPSSLLGLEALRRAHGVAETTFSPGEPGGVVRIGAERWRARLACDARGAVRDGERVRVRDVQGLTLLVDPAEPVQRVPVEPGSDAPEGPPAAG